MESTEGGADGISGERMGDPSRVRKEHEAQGGRVKGRHGSIFSQNTNNGRLGTVCKRELLKPTMHKQNLKGKTTNECQALLRIIQALVK